MSSNTTNYGVQTIVFDYRQEARGKGFDQAFCDILPYGLYSGGQLTRISDTIINVGLLVCVIKSDEDDKVALRVETNAPQNILLSSFFGSAYADVTKPYIVLRFGWHDVEANYMDMRAVGWSANQNEIDPDKLHPLDIILGKVLFQAAPDGSGKFIIAPENSFDLSRRQDVFIKETISISGQFRVSPSEIDPKKVFVSGGKVNTSKGRFFIPGSEFPSTGIPDTAAMGRTDLIAVNVNGEFQFIQGSPSALFPAPAPKYQNFKVLAEIQRGPNRSNVIGTDIVQTTDATIRGAVAAEDFPLLDSERFLPANAKNIEDAFNYLFHHSIAVSPQDLATLGVVLRRNVNWGASDPDGVYAGSVPVKDSSGLFASADVESVLSEIAGAGRTDESLKGLADAIDALVVALSEETTSRESADTSLANSKQNNLNRTVGGNDNAKGTVTDTGGNLSVPMPVTTVAPSASSTQTAAGTRSLRDQIKILIDNIAQLFSSLSSHTENKNNPHDVTKAQVGLGNVPNTDATNASNISSGTLPAARLSGTLTDAAAATALPSTASETMWTKLQTVRNNLKALFSYFTSGVANNADKLDGQEGTYYQNAGNLNAGTLPAARLPAHTGDVTSSAGSTALTLVAAQVLAKLLTVDGANSGLNADLLDDKHGSEYVQTTGAQTIAGAKTFSTPPIGVSNLAKYNDGVTAGNIFANPPLNTMGAISYHHFEDNPFPAANKSPIQSGGAESWDIVTLNLSHRRATQIAVQIYNVGHQGRVFIRNRHVDNDDYSQWQAWKEIVKLNDGFAFTQASSRANIASGETLSVLLGKIMKWLADLGTAAFTASSAYATAAQGTKADNAATASSLTSHTGATSNPHSVTKTQVGLGNVPNTDATNASNISSGTLSNDRLPPSPSVVSITVAYDPAYPS